MRNAFAEALYQAAKDDPRIAVVVADISPAGSMAKFAQEFPDRFVNVGVAEQCMIGIAAGMALKGLRPFCYTIATFALYRPFEFVRDDLCYQNLPVTVVGMGAGLTYSTLGSTHHSQEDIAIASALPNMQIIAPCDPAETAEAVKWCATENKGPVYLRLGKAGEPSLTDGAANWQFGIARCLCAAEPDELCILTYGTIARYAVAFARNHTATVFSVHTLKPLDRPRIESVLGRFKRVIVIEEHAPRGGLASMVKEIAWDAKATCRLNTFTLKDEFIHNYGSQVELLAQHGIEPERMLSMAVA